MVCVFDSMEYLENEQYFQMLVGLQVTWERLQQLGDIPCARDGHTLRYVKV